MKSRNYCFELYPDSETYNYNDLVDFIKNNFDYVMILHNQDIYNDDEKDEQGNIIHKKGDKKKAHLHVELSFKNPRSIKFIQDNFENIHVESCNFYAYTRYLIHLGYPNKYQYSINDIETNIYVRVENALKRDYNSQEQDTRLLLDYIFSREGSVLTFKQLTEYAMENDCLLDLKKNTYFYKSFCDDFGFRRL